MRVRRQDARLWGELSRGCYFSGREVSPVCRRGRSARTASILRTEAPGAPPERGPRRVAVQAFCCRRRCSDLKKQKRKLLFHPVSFEEEAARDQGCPPVCVWLRVCCVCVSACVGTREERERDTRVKQIGRAAQKTAAFGHVLETEARLQRLHAEKSYKQNLLCIASPVHWFWSCSEYSFGGSFWRPQSTGQVWPLIDAPRDFDADDSLTSCCWTWAHLWPKKGRRRARSCCPLFLLSLAEWTHFWKSEFFSIWA